VDTSSPLNKNFITAFAQSCIISDTLVSKTAFAILGSSVLLKYPVASANLTKKLLKLALIFSFSLSFNSASALFDFNTLNAVTSVRKYKITYMTNSNSITYF
jgi:hypothetical protein